MKPTPEGLAKLQKIHAEYLKQKGTLRKPITPAPKVADKDYGDAKVDMGDLDKDVSRWTGKVFTKEDTDMKLDEGKMGELHASIGQHMDKHIGKYKKMGGAEALMSHADHAAKSISTMHKIPLEHAHKFVAGYIDSHLSEGVRYDQLEETTKVDKDWYADEEKMLKKTKGKGTKPLVKESVQYIQSLVEEKLSAKHKEV
jgi:hypothetical protein